MRTILHLVLVLSLISFPTFAQEKRLTNADIIALHQAGFSADLIITKIKTSKNDFNTSVEALSILKRAGLTENVIAAMMEANTLEETKASPISASVLNPNEVILREATQVEVEINDTVSSDEMKEGDLIYFTVITPVSAQGRLVIPRGAPAIARVTKAEAGKSWARGGNLAWQMQSVLAVDGQRIPLRFSTSAKGDGKNGEMTTGIVVTGLLFWPAAPLWGFKKGKAASIPAGKRFMVYVHSDSVIASNYAASDNIYMQQQRKVQLPGYVNGQPIPMEKIIDAKNLKDLRRTQ